MRLFEERIGKEQKAWYAVPGDLGWDVANPFLFCFCFLEGAVVLLLGFRFCVPRAVKTVSKNVHKQ